ncbi:MAG TPA: winged helix-turn-helix domain-containing protein, partial [Pyrinomonadaceae bacterium]|nr:winged helix-turn-helix domain-containing protein [Pyrinomonadaceae bacterium]
METLTIKNISFRDFEIDVIKRRLFKSGEIIGLNSKTFDLLLTLAENHGQILSKDELLDRVWAGQFVEENNLTVHISALRKIFDEKKGEPQFILTVPGKGYKFIADVQINNFAQISRSQTVNYPTALVAPPNEFETEEIFLGRTEEILEVKKLLRQSEVSLVTLTGAGGTGKTRLANVVARQLKKDFPSGVFFIELVTATETEYVISAIAQTLNVVESSNKSLLESIKDFLCEQRILLVLDNFEQVMSAVPLVRELLVTSSTLKILVTSRAPLHLGIEHEFFVKPLDLPPTDAEFALEKLAEYPSILLFCKRARPRTTNHATKG